MDIWTKEKRSLVMSKIRGRNTKPERIVRSHLTDMGFRYRLNVKDLPGKPDIVLRRYGVIVFIHGCFWHMCPHCREGRIPTSRSTYWEGKLLKNKSRDRKNIRKLQRDGWKVLKLWECEIEGKLNKVIEKLIRALSEKNV